MLSRHKTTRQIPLTTTYYDATTVVNNPGQYAYSFIPTTGQGAYANVYTTKGYMQDAEVDEVLGGTLKLSIEQAVAAAGGPNMVVLRDLGKTVSAQYWTFVNITTFDRNTKGYFRQVQLISPTALGANGWNGGPNGSTFGVTGFPSQSFQISTSDPLNLSSYLTFYIPVSIANITGAGATSTEAFAIAGGQV